MIVRMWKGYATAERAIRYTRHATCTVFPKLEAIFGFRGAYLLQRPVEEGVEFLVLTLWDSMDVVRQFAGDRVDQAVVEPQARSLLSRFDDLVTHFQVVATGTEFH